MAEESKEGLRMRLGKQSPILAGRRDDQVVDGDVFRLVERVNHGTRDIVGGDGNSVERLGSLAPFRITDLVGPAGIDDTRADRVDADAVLHTELLAHGLGHGLNEKFCCAVNTRRRSDLMTGNRVHIENLPGLALQHERQHRRRSVEFDAPESRRW